MSNVDARPTAAMDFFTKVRREILIMGKGKKSEREGT
jgi:hypothetical protein